MAHAGPSETTQLLRAWANGDAGALGRLATRVYPELRRLAGHYMRNRQPGETVQTTALVHEAYLRLVDLGHVDWKDRAHFFACSAQIMRRILLDGARRRLAARRGGGSPRVNLDEPPDVLSSRAKEMIALDDALTALAEVQPRKARIVEMRFFAGLSVEETAAVLGVSPDTVMRDWKLAKLWLRAELGAKC
ncbi:MAG: sigma-70 family RNA polymerase sigma factor [Acidobacteria bacterium]|nr:sigma-70 family RNA polymerase sigma factor [Acidobacteriota bacterium]